MMLGGELIDRTGFHRWDHIKFARRLSELTLAKKKKKLDISFSDTGIKKTWMKEEVSGEKSLLDSFLSHIKTWGGYLMFTPAQTHMFELDLPLLLSVSLDPDGHKLCHEL